MEFLDSHKEELSNQRKAGLITLVINILLFLLIYFIVVWRAPDPPLSSYGLELNLGFSDLGSGDKPTTTQSSDALTTPTDAPAPGEIAPKPVESAVPVTQPKTEVAKSKETSTKSNIEAVSKAPSTVKASENPTAVSRDASNKTTPQPTRQPSTAEAEKTVTKAEEKPKVDQRAIFGAGGTAGTGSTPAAGSAQGSSNQRGDEGRPTGTVDGRGLMGESGSGRGNPGSGFGSGYNLDLAGWDFASKPNIQDKVSTRNGRIVFNITVDDNGKIVRAIPLEYNVSNEVLAYYRTIVNQLSFRRQTGNPAAEYSSGKITFIIKID
jgi:hypothetical protein